MQQGGLRALRHLTPGRLLLPHTWPGCFLFSSRSFSFLATERPSFFVCSSFFFFHSCAALRQAHDLLHSGKRCAEYNLPLSTPSRAVTRVRHVRTFVAYLPQQRFNFFIQRSPFKDLLYLHFNYCKTIFFCSE